MKKVLLVLLVLFCGVVTTVSAQVESGLPVPLALANDISSKYLKVGQDVPFFVTSDVFDNEGELVIPEGTIAKGKVVSNKKRGCFGKGGKFTISIESITLRNGEMIELSGDDLSAKGKKNKYMPVAYVFCYAIFPIIIAAAMKGDYAVLEAGTPIQAFVK